MLKVDRPFDQNHLKKTHFEIILGIPGLTSMFNSNLDPFAILGLRRQNWWEGPNVCTERKVLVDNEEQVEDESIDENQRRGGKFFAMDMSFTSCRDDISFHECTTTINRNGKNRWGLPLINFCYLMIYFLLQVKRRVSP